MDVPGILQDLDSFCWVKTGLHFLVLTSAGIENVGVGSDHRAGLLGGFLQQHIDISFWPKCLGWRSGTCISGVMSGEKRVIA